MTSDPETQDQPIMDGAHDASAQERKDGRDDQVDADEAAYGRNPVQGSHPSDTGEETEAATIESDVPDGHPLDDSPH